jgi:hypothetical protein
MVAAVAISCGGSTGSPRPSASLVALDFTPPPTLAPPSIRASRSPGIPATPPGWPIGWDIAFCNAFADTTVAHQLVIDIERAMADGSTSDAQGLANELARSAPIAANEVAHLKDWAPAADVKTTFTSILDLDGQAAAAYQSYFNDGVKTALKTARDLRHQVSKAVPAANDQLQQLAALGLNCSGSGLQLETF